MNGKADSAGLDPSRRVGRGSGIRRLQFAHVQFTLNNMVKASKSTPASDPVRKQAVIYARVSSKEQEKEGFSIPAQLKLLKEYASANGFAVAEEYIDVETAKQTGRTAFGEMVAYLKAHPSIRAMLVEKTDRLYRNLKDWVTIDELNVEMHFPKEGVVLSRESRSSEKFMHGIKVLMAKNYIDNLSEEARKGMQEKAEQGIWPTKAPLGYRNITGLDGKKIIVTDPAIAPLIAKLFDWYGRGDISLKEAARKAHAAGLLYPKSGAKVPVSTVHTILHNRLYTGWFEWNGKLIQGKHEALVPVELWERVQGVLDGRSAKRAKRGKHDFAFSGLIGCHACGCAVVGEVKKERYVYYHCTGYADKCQGNPASCRRKYVREEALEAQFAELLGLLKFDDEVLEWVREALHASHADERREHEEAIRRHQAPSGRIQATDRSHSRHVCRQARWTGRDGLFRENVEPVARGTDSLPARDRPAPESRRILSGRGRAASRTGPQCPAAVRKAGAA
ncbi:MAG: recombinase family protein [Bradyrhizobium sp.]|uniref:recombinase family protein n=1 Tax=Bradyrhizobium sp. TaxID=376 RepID=UPI00271B7018|nr:recombinase family protein [Bradyrhizobium sp.]MDO8400513.1 recombinase family protein [Bradyrhizobium sp.]